MPKKKAAKKPVATKKKPAAKPAKKKPAAKKLTREDYRRAFSWPTENLRLALQEVTLRPSFTVDEVIEEFVSYSQQDAHELQKELAKFLRRRYVWNGKAFVKK